MGTTSGCFNSGRMTWVLGVGVQDRGYLGRGRRRLGCVRWHWGVRDCIGVTRVLYAACSGKKHTYIKLHQWSVSKMHYLMALLRRSYPSQHLSPLLS